MPQRVQRTRKAGQPGIPQGAVYVGRGRGDYGRYGNPFVVGVDADDRKHATALYREWLETNSPTVYNPYAGAEYLDAMNDRRDRILEHIGELAGRDLACWCPLPQPGQPDHCHASVLLHLAKDLEGISL